jgi:hypothetical protein
MAGILKNTRTKNSMPGFFGNQGLTTIQNASPVTATPIKTQRRIFMKIIPSRDLRMRQLETGASSHVSLFTIQRGHCGIEFFRRTIVKLSILEKIVRLFKK